MKFCPIFRITFLAVVYTLNCKQVSNVMYHTSEENKPHFKQQESAFIIIIYLVFIIAKLNINCSLLFF